MESTHDVLIDQTTDIQSDVIFKVINKIKVIAGTIQSPTTNKNTLFL